MAPEVFLLPKQRKALYTKSHDLAEAKSAPREHSLFVLTYGAPEAEVAGAEVAEAYATWRTTTVLRDSNPVKCPRAAVALREHSFLVVASGATEAEAAEAEAAATYATECMTTVLRDSNLIKCSAVKPTFCGRTTGAFPSCGYYYGATEA